MANQNAEAAPATTKLSLPEFDPAVLARLPSPEAKAAFIDRWLLKRIEEAVEISKRFDQRLRACGARADELEQLTSAAHLAFQADLDSIETKLDVAADRAIAQVEQRVEQFESRLLGARDRAEVAIAAAEDSLHRRIATMRDSVDSKVDSVAEETAAKLDGIVNHLHQCAATLEETLLNKFSAVKRASELVTQDMQRQIDASQTVADALVSHVQMSINRSVDEGRSVVEIITKQIRDAAAENESAITRLLQSADDALAAKLAAFHRGSDEHAAVIADKLKDEVTRHRELLEIELKQAAADQGRKLDSLRAVLVCEQVRQESAAAKMIDNFRETLARLVEDSAATLRDQIESVGHEAGRAAAPHVAAIAEMRESLGERIALARHEVEEDIRQRAHELTMSGQQFLDQIEERMAEKIARVGPKIQSTVDESESRIRSAMEQLAKMSNEIVSQSEIQLMAKLGELSPRALEIARRVESEMADTMRRLEENADTMTQWLERRISTRVEEVVRTSRGTMRDQLAKLDAARSELRGIKERVTATADHSQAA